MKALQVINSLLLFGIFVVAWSILSRLDRQLYVYEERDPVRVEIAR